MNRSNERKRRNQLLQRKLQQRKQPPTDVSQTDSWTCADCGTPLEFMTDDDEDIEWLLQNLRGGNSVPDGENYVPYGELTWFFEPTEDAHYLSNGIRFKFHPGLLEVVAPESMRNSSYLDTMIAEALVSHYSSFETYWSVYAQQGHAAAMAYFVETAGDIEIDVSYKTISIPATAQVSPS